MPRSHNIMSAILHAYNMIQVFVYLHVLQKNDTLAGSIMVMVFLLSALALSHSIATFVTATSNDGYRNG